MKDFIRKIKKNIQLFFIKDEDVWHYQYVYVEDDKYERMEWRESANRANVKLLLLENAKDFFKYRKNISREKTLIYLDCDLGINQVRGDDFARVLNTKGYKNIYMASNFSASKFSHLPWLKCAGKGCPFS